MTIIMRKNIGEKRLLDVPAISALGDGILCVTSHAVAYEVHGRGLYLNFIPKSTIIGIRISKSGLFGTRRCSLAWMEGKTRHQFEFRTRQHVMLGSILKQDAER